MICILKVLSNQGDSGVTPETLSQVKNLQHKIKQTKFLDPPSLSSQLNSCNTKSLSWRWSGKSVCDPWTTREVLRDRDQPHEEIFGGQPLSYQYNRLTSPISSQCFVFFYWKWVKWFFFQGGGSILVLLGEGGENRFGTNINFLLEEWVQILVIGE